MSRRFDLVYWGWTQPTPEEARTIGLSPLVHPFGARRPRSRSQRARAVDGPVWRQRLGWIAWRRWPAPAWGVSLRLGRWEGHLG